MRRQNTMEDWKKLGDLCKVAYNATLEAHVMASNMTTKSNKGAQELGKAYTAITNAKSTLENYMISELDPEGTMENNNELLNVFYGQDE